MILLLPYAVSNTYAHGEAELIPRGSECLLATKTYNFIANVRNIIAHIIDSQITSLYE